MWGLHFPRGRSTLVLDLDSDGSRSWPSSCFLVESSLRSNLSFLHYDQLTSLLAENWILKNWLECMITLKNCPEARGGVYVGVFILWLKFFSGVMHTFERFA